MDILYEKLKEMRKRPGMYLGKKSLVLLEAFINGYMTRQYEIDSNYKTTFLGFKKYVQQYFNLDIDYEWLRIITFFSSSDEQAVDLFYNILDKFLEENFQSEEIQAYQIVQTIYANRAIKEIHFTDHGNPEIHTNPHEHEILWISNGNYYYDYLSTDFNHTGKQMPKKSSRDKFIGIDEFVNNLSRGGEVEFVFHEKAYSITHLGEKLCFIRIGDKTSKKCFKMLEEFLDYQIEDQKIRDIVTKIQPYFRCF